MKTNNKIIGISLAALMISLLLTGVFANANTENSKIEKIVEVYKDKSEKKFTDEQIVNALYSMIEAESQLTTNYKELVKEEIKRESFIRGSKDYENADAKLSSEYESALAAAKVLLNDERTTSQQLQYALFSLREIETKITKDYKIALKNEIKYSEEVLKSDIYNNAQIQKSADYDNALAASKLILNDAKSNEEQIKNAVINLKEARENMDIKPNYKISLEEEVAKESKVKESSEFKNAKIELSSEYVKALSDSKSLLEQENPTTEDLNISLFVLKEARKNLGFKDLVMLQEEVDRADKVRKSKEYKNATDEDEANYENALAAARVVLSESK